MSKEQIRTRRQIAYSRQEQEQLRLIYTALGVVAGLVAVVLLFGLVQSYYLEPNAAIATVNGTKITVGEYRDRVRYERFLLEQQYTQIAQQQANLTKDGNEQFAQFYQQYANQILQQRSVVDQQTVDQMIEDKLLETEATKRGIKVSDDEVNEYINRLMAGQLGGVTQPSAEKTVAAQVQATTTAAAWTPTPTFTPEPTLTSTKGLTPTATPENTPLPGPTPTLNIIQGSQLSTQYSNWLKVLNDNVTIDEATYRKIIYQTVLSDKVREAISGETPKKALQAHARHILISWQQDSPSVGEGTATPEVNAEEKAKAEEVAKAKAKQTAEDVIKRLKSGEDFVKLAEEFSDDTGSKFGGGDLGFVPKGRFVEPVDKAIFELPIGKVGDEPVESQFGWHVLEVVERGDHELSASDYEQSKREQFSTWLSDTKKEATIEDNWTVDKAPKDSFLAR